MNNSFFLKQIGKLFEYNTSLLRKEIKESKERIRKEIVLSQEDNIDILREVMHVGHTNHEGRIQVIEKKLAINS